MNDINDSNVINEFDIIDDQPSGAIKKMLSIGAKAMISTSKKIMNSVVSNYRPPIILSSLKDADTIKLFIEKSIKYKSREMMTLREIALNNINTIDIAKNINQSLIDEYNIEVDNFRDKFAVEENSVRYNSIKMDLEEKKSTLDEKSEFAHKFSIIKSIKGKKSSSDIINDIQHLDRKYPNWSNPIIADYYLKLTDDLLIKKKCISILLFYYPTNTLYLKIAKEIENNTHIEVFDQISALNKRK